MGGLHLLVNTQYTLKKVLRLRRSAGGKVCNTRPERLKKCLHCNRAVSQQVSLKLSGRMVGLKWLDWDEGRVGWSALPSLSPPSPICFLPTTILTRSAITSLFFSSSNWGSGCWSGRSAQMWHRPHLPLTNRTMAKKSEENLHEHQRSCSN